ncbi:hypothetical protein SAMN04489761_0193 [Tenacibaculum sp. MAR_2009_124]|uniref:ACT domain-containing protein n=1 Tax=Tenacibaculum sp. MAR_2009_124 TaxID=1250059 RepID=UPI000898373F|nr:ACT domain-containing protein [Tenacibaculum sp. MAR_2009_124]SEB36776.1 hypothetical protein SAMN04489761_0193 [Tenacibaculum sp. MAR_2009_124]
MSGETNLKILISEMEPILNKGEYVFSTIKNCDHIPREITICEIKESEGVTLVLSKEHADKYGLSYDYVAAWITLNIHSSLDAVGLTAAFSSKLGNSNISCNVIAGYYHDHIFVDVKDKEKAMSSLLAMTNQKI